MKVLQINLNRCAAAQDIMKQMLREEKADIAVLSEFHRPLTGVWVQDLTGKAGIWAPGGSRLTRVRAGYGFVRAFIGETLVYSCYESPNAPIESLDLLLTDIQQDLLGNSRQW